MSKEVDVERSFATVAAVLARAMPAQALTAGLYTSKSANPFKLMTRTLVTGVRESRYHGDVIVAVGACTVAHTRRMSAGA
jgi:hypothetical protein